MNLCKTTIEQDDIVHFASSVQEIFKKMLGWDIEVIEATDLPVGETTHDVSGVIGLAGAVQATVVVSLELEIALCAAEAFLGERPSELNSDILDLVAELANMVAGSTKERMGIEGISLGLPTTISGKGHQVFFEPGVKIERVQLRCQAGELTIQIAVLDRC